MSNTATSDAFPGLRPLLSASRFLGLCPIRVEGSAVSRSISAPAYLRVYGVLLCLLTICCNLYTWTWALPYVDKWHFSVYNITLLLSSPLQILVYFMTVIPTLARWRSIGRVVTGVCARRLPDHAARSVLVCCTLQMAALFTIVLVDHLITLPADYELKFIFGYVVSFACTFSGLFVVVQYTTFVFLIERQLRGLNVELAGMARSDDGLGRRLRRPRHRILENTEVRWWHLLPAPTTQTSSTAERRSPISARGLSRQAVVRPIGSTPYRAVSDQSSSVSQRPSSPLRHFAAVCSPVLRRRRTTPRGALLATRLRTSAATQHALCEVADELGSTYGCQLVSQVARCYLHVVVALYNLLSVSLRRLDSSQHEEQIARGTSPRFLYVLVANTIMVWWLVYTTERARRQFSLLLTYKNLDLDPDCGRPGCWLQGQAHLSLQGRNTGPLVHKLMNNIHDEEIKEKLKEFSLQLLHRRIHFTACGILPLDFTLLLSIIGASTTYLLMLIQFQMSYGQQVRANTTSTP